MTRPTMTQQPGSKEVTLSLRDLLAIASGVFAIIGTVWGFSNRIESSIAVIGERMIHMNSRIEALERERDRLPWLRGFPAGTGQPNPSAQPTP